MLAATLSQARTPTRLPKYPICLQCRYKSNLSAINRSLDQQIRRERRNTLKDADRGSQPESTNHSRTQHVDSPRPKRRSTGSVLGIDFAEKRDFTPENWDRLMAALKRAENDFIQALPKVPSQLPAYDLSNPTPQNDLRRQLKHAFKQAFQDTEPKLGKQREEWSRIFKHVVYALRMAVEKNLFIPERPWFIQTDPESVLKAVNGYTGDVMNRDMRKELIKKRIKAVEAVMRRGGDPNTELANEASESARHDESLGFGTVSEQSSNKKLSKQEKKKLQEEEAKMQKDYYQQDKARKRLEAESWLADEQLDVLIKNNKEKHNDRKNKSKEIQEPKSKEKSTAPPSSPVPLADVPRRDGGGEAYVSIPYTTAASEFLYGLNVVVAALKARRRQLYNLYIHSRALSNLSVIKRLRTLALKSRLRWTEVEDSFLQNMDKMSQGRPHNGVVLEASPLPTLPTKSLGKVQVTATSIPIQLSEQSDEDRAINGAPSSIPCHFHATWRKPLVLLLDGILDPGNLGNILRTAHFYGVDAVAVCVNTCAPVNLATVQKAASGAAEALTILSINTPANFITQCSKNGWLIQAAVAPEAYSSKPSSKNKQLFTDHMESPLARGPSILMIGAEGEGLRKNLQSKADSYVGIRGVKIPVPELDVGVESLNVGTAVAVLLEAFMRKPDNLEDTIKGTPRDQDVTARIV